MAKLKNVKHERFCQEYCKSHNVTQSYIKAGYSKKTAQAASSRLLSQVIIEHRIEELEERVSKKLEISAENIGREFMKIGFANVKSFVNDNGTIKGLHELPDELTAAVSSIKTKTLKSAKNTSVIETELKFHSKERSLEALGKHIGWFEAHNEQKREREDFSQVSTKELVSRARAIKEIENK